MGAVATAAATVDTDIAALSTAVAALVAAINTSQTSYFAATATAGQYQQALSTYKENIKQAIAGYSALLALILDYPNPTVLADVPSLATQYANY